MRAHGFRPLIALCLAAIFAGFVPSRASAQEWVSFPGRGGVTVKAALLKPEGKGPFPAVVALHGCGGLPSGGQALGARDRDWADRLVGAGFIVLFPESFASRGLGPQCNIRDRDVRSKDRALDAFAAAEWLATRSDVDARRMGLLGWSNGGTSVLSAARDIRKPRGVEFKTAIAFYPGCRVMAEQGFRPRIPVTILHGLADDWTPAAPCQSLNGVTFIGYPEAHHDFDHPNLPLRTRKAAFSANGTGIVTVATHPAARAAATTRALAIFRAM